MNILLVAEGEHELNPDEENSALAQIVRRLLPSVSQIDRQKLSGRTVQLAPVPGKKLPHQKRLKLWIKWAEKQGYDAIIAVIDEDDKADRKQAVDDLQGSAFSSMPRALGLAIRMFDAWMLADEQALSAVLGGTVQRQKKPEGIRQPKEEFERLLEESLKSLSQREAYLQVAQYLDLDKMAERCPKGFAPFRRHVEQLRGKPE